MEQNDAVFLAAKMVEFHTKIFGWSKNYFLKNFKINGKGDGLITLRQFHLLFLIHTFHMNDLQQLVDFLQLSKSSLSLTITKLVQEGYILKQRPDASGDGRKVYFSLTPKGVDILEKMKHQVVETVSEFCAVLTEQQKEDLKIGLEKLSRIYSIYEEEEE